MDGYCPNFIDSLLGRGKELINFGDFDLIFNVTPALYVHRVCVHYLLDQWMDFDQTCINAMLGEGEVLIGFW